MLLREVLPEGVECTFRWRAHPFDGFSFDGYAGRLHSGSCFVEFDNASIAAEMLKVLSSATIYGRAIRVQVARPRITFGQDRFHTAMTECSVTPPVDWANSSTHSVADSAYHSRPSSPAPNAKFKPFTTELCYHFSGVFDNKIVSINAGETVTVAEKLESGWWLVRTQDGRQGYVPSYWIEDEQKPAQLKFTGGLPPSPNTKGLGKSRWA
ncbi:hypothetical protein OQA88_8208 [Cercophora sp. LCS_1]